MKISRLALLGAAMSAPAAAENIQFNALVSADLGYTSNPFLAPGTDAGSFTAAASIKPHLLYQTERSTTDLQGDYSRESYLHRFGYTDSGSIGLIRTDKLAEHLTSILSGSYTTSNRATINGIDQVTVEDPGAIGRRTKSIVGGYQMQWQATGHDQFNTGVQVQHSSYGKGRDLGVGTGLASSYTQYSGNVGYNHTLDVRTSVGAQVSVSATHSRIYPDSRVVQPSLTAKRQLNTIWEVDGHVGVIFQRIQGPFSRSNTSLGLGLNLCGAYPHTKICFDASRDTTPSGFGSLRTATTISAHLTRDLDEHSRVSFDAQYLKSSSTNLPTEATSLLFKDVKAYLASADYDRDLTQRISAGFGGRFQQREFTDRPAGRSYAATIHLRAKLGRI